MVKDQVWRSSSHCPMTSSGPKTTISNFAVILEELANDSPKIARLPMLGPTCRYFVNNKTRCNYNYHHFKQSKNINSWRIVCLIKTKINLSVPNSIFCPVSIRSQSGIQPWPRSNNCPFSKTPWSLFFWWIGFFGNHSPQFNLNTWILKGYSMAVKLK